MGVLSKIWGYFGRSSSQRNPENVPEPEIIPAAPQNVVEAVDPIQEIINNQPILLIHKINANSEIPGFALAADPFSSGIQHRQATPSAPMLKCQHSGCGKKFKKKDLLKKHVSNGKALR